MTMSMGMGHVIPPTHFGHDRHTDIYMSSEISIEHPSVGLASLAQSRKILIEQASVGFASLAQKGISY